MKLQQYLTEKRIPFEVLSHRPTYDAQHMAQSVHVSGHEVAKTVLLRCSGKPEFAVAVLPASHMLDLAKACEALGASEAVLASEMEMLQHCPECEIGALPPFGSCYEMATVADASLAEKDQIVFEGDTHEETIRMKFADFDQLEHPVVAPIAI